MSTMEQSQSNNIKNIEEALNPIKKTTSARVKKSEVKDTSDVTEPKSSRAKKSEVKESSEVKDSSDVTEPKSSRAKKSEVKESSDVTEPKSSRAKKSEVKDTSDVTEAKSSRAKKSEVKETSEVKEKSKKAQPKKDDSKEEKPINDNYINASEIEELLLFSQKCKQLCNMQYDNIIENINNIQQNTNSIEVIRNSTNSIYKNLFDVLSNNNLLITNIHNLHINFVMTTTNKLSRELYLEITKECCANIDKLRDTYINSADQHNDSLTKLYVQLNEFLESLQNSTNLITDKAVKNVINSDSENSDTGSDKLTISKNHKPSKTLKLEKSIIKSDSDSDSE